MVSSLQSLFPLSSLEELIGSLVLSLLLAWMLFFLIRVFSEFTVSELKIERKEKKFDGEGRGENEENEGGESEGEEGTWKEAGESEKEEGREAQRSDDAKRGGSIANEFVGSRAIKIQGMSQDVTRDGDVKESDDLVDNGVIYGTELTEPYSKVPLMPPSSVQSKSMTEDTVSTREERAREVTGKVERARVEMSEGETDNAEEREEKYDSTLEKNSTNSVPLSVPFTATAEPAFRFGLGIVESGTTIVSPELSLNDKVLSEDEEDWENISDGERSSGEPQGEVETAFDRAANFVSGLVVTSSAVNNISPALRLKLYGLYKHATEGPCTAEQPKGMFNYEAKAKWVAWKSVGEGVSRGEAMLLYSELVERELKRGRETEGEKGDENHAPGNTGIGGPVFSRMLVEESSDRGEKGERKSVSSPTTLFLSFLSAVKEGNVEEMERSREKAERKGEKSLGHVQDEDGRTALHWAADSGKIHAVRYLIDNSLVDINAQDSEGLTALHYARTCEHTSISELLLASGADGDIRDNDGKTPGEEE